jgi:hypothetical protein
MHYTLAALEFVWSVHSLSILRIDEILNLITPEDIPPTHVDRTMEIIQIRVLGQEDHRVRD